MRGGPLVGENPISFRSSLFCAGLAGLGLRAGLLAAVLSAALAAPAGAQTSAPAPTPPASTLAKPADPFGEDTTLPAKTMVYVKGSGSWDNAFATISGSFKKLKAYIDKEGLKADGLPLTIFTSTDDAGFEYQAAIPLAEAPKSAPRGDILVGETPQGKALKFVHRGSYDDLDNTYEAITNYLDDRRIEANDMFIEEYVTDPLSTDENKLVVNVYVLVKPGQSSPG